MTERESERGRGRSLFEKLNILSVISDCRERRYIYNIILSVIFHSLFTICFSSSIITYCSSFPLRFTKRVIVDSISRVDFDGYIVIIIHRGHCMCKSYSRDFINRFFFFFFFFFYVRFISTFFRYTASKYDLVALLSLSTRSISVSPKTRCETSINIDFIRILVVSNTGEICARITRRSRKR